MNKITETIRGELDGDPVTIMEWGFHTDTIDVTPMSTTVPDPRWTFVDSNQHFHATSADRERPFPTLTKTEEPDMDCPAEYEDDEMPTRTVYRCVACGEEVQPGFTTTSGVHRTTAPGRSYWRMVVSRPDALKRADLTVSLRVRLDKTTEGFGIGRIIEIGRDSITVEGSGSLGTRKL